MTRPNISNLEWLRQEYGLAKLAIAASAALCGFAFLIGVQLGHLYTVGIIHF